MFEVKTSNIAERCRKMRFSGQPRRLNEDLGPNVAPENLVCKWLSAGSCVAAEIMQQLRISEQLRH